LNAFPQIRETDLVTRWKKSWPPLHAQCSRWLGVAKLNHDTKSILSRSSLS